MMARLDKLRKRLLSSVSSYGSITSICQAQIRQAGTKTSQKPNLHTQRCEWLNNNFHSISDTRSSPLPPSRQMAASIKLNTWFAYLITWTYFHFQVEIYDSFFDLVFVTVLATSTRVALSIASCGTLWMALCSTAPLVGILWVLLLSLVIAGWVLMRAWFTHTAVTLSRVVVGTASVRPC